jgi:integrase
VSLDTARGDRFEALYVLSLTVGLRMGEALGLRWSDIDLDAKTLRMSRQLQRMRDGGELGYLSQDRRRSVVGADLQSDVSRVHNRVRSSDLVSRTSVPLWKTPFIARSRQSIVES